MGRERLVIPLAAAVTTLWLAAGFYALVTTEVRVLVIASGPFSIIIGYVFGVSLVRRAENHVGEGGG